MLKAVIFDFDGLLADTTPIHREADEIFLSHYHKIRLPSKGGREGMRIEEIVQDYKDIYDLPGTINELFNERQQIFYGLINSKLEFFPGTLPLLEKLKSHKIKIALATSGDQKYLQIVWNKFPNYYKFFQLIITGDEVLRGKPYPDIYESVLNKLNIRSYEAVVLEDSANGIVSAKAAGIPVICIPNKHYPDADYSQADKIFPSLVEFSSVII